MNPKPRKKHSKPMNQEETRFCIEQYKAGKSLHELGRMMDRSFMTICAVLKRNGIERRSDSPPGAENRFYRGGRFSQPKAISQVGMAVQAGKLKRPANCETCGCPDRRTKHNRSYIHAHHCDYNKPLEVMWLCKKCHHTWHENNKAIQLRENESA